MNQRDVLKTYCMGAAALAAEKLAPFAPAADPAPGLLTRKIPSSGEPLPVIGLGTWQTFDVGRSQDARAPQAEVLGAFAELGGKLVDSSPMYGNSEEVVGDLAAQLGLQTFHRHEGMDLRTAGRHHADGGFDAQAPCRSNRSHAGA